MMGIHDAVADLELDMNRNLWLEVIQVLFR
jgi:hypothetical protein